MAMFARLGLPFQALPGAEPRVLPAEFRGDSG